MGQWMRLAVSPLKLGISQSQHEASAFNGKAVLSTLAQPVHKAQPQPFYLYISSKKAMKSLIFGPNLSIKTALLEFYPISSWISPILANPLRPGLAFSKQCHQSRSWAKSWPRLCFRITFLMIPGDFCPHDFKRNGSILHGYETCSFMKTFIFFGSAAHLLPNVEPWPFIRTFILANVGGFEPTELHPLSNV